MKKASKRAARTEVEGGVDWSKARRGRWAGRLRTPKVAFIRPDLWERFGSNDAINEALATLIELSEVVPRAKRRAG